MFSDEQFAGLFPAKGKPAWSPGRLAMVLVLVLRFVEALTDRQAAEAVRARIDWKYALGLEPADAGFDFSVLSEFRDRLVGADGGQEVLDAVLAAARRQGRVTARGSARTDSTHELSAVRELNQLELVAETLRTALNAVALAEPGWLSEHARPEWFKHYATRAEDSRFPKERSRRDETYRRIGDDGMHLLRMIRAQDVPAVLRGLPEVEVLRQVWVQYFHLVDGEVARRGPKDRPPGVMRLVSPSGLEARSGAERDLNWDGYKVHITETCDEGTPHLVTSVMTTTASVADNRMADPVHEELARRDLLPGEHWVDAGYASAGSLRHHLPGSPNLRPAQNPLSRPREDQPPTPTHRRSRQPHPHQRRLTNTPRARTRTSPLTALRPAAQRRGEATRPELTNSIRISSGTGPKGFVGACISGRRPSAARGR